MLNGIVEKLQAATQGMADKLVGFATTLFWSLAVINMVITFGMLIFRKADIGEFFAEFVRFTITLGFFWWLLSNAVSGMNIGGTIIESMRNMAAQATGLGRELSPSGIVDVGFNVFFTVYNADLGIADKLLAYAVAVIILLIFAAVAVNMVLVLAESWFLLYGGLFVLGFGGSRWTSDIAIGYYRQVLGVGFKLFGMAVIIGVGKGFIDGFLADLSGKPGILELAVVLVAAFVFFKLSERIPSMMAGLISGGGGIGGGFAGGSGAVSAAGIAGAAIAAAGGVAAIAATVAKMIGGQEGAGVDGASALMKAASAATRALSTDSLTAGFGAWGGSSSGDGGGQSDAGGSQGGGSGSGETPMAAAAGYNDTGRAGSSSAPSQATNQARSNDAAGSGGLFENAGTRTAQASRHDAAPTFDGNSLAGTNANTAAEVNDEVAAFVNRPQAT
ncbi:P-type conjugative transfer protein TrbL [Burkholderia multivorans]|uniref:P-type conjugative transfer protein TrbL n=1 Tax=Burkholderia multivorans TaxID=87883 RepID=UPI0021C0859F|nr:P-type conjugative transfer protein TrbL [Burkholderia multivorans]